MILAIPFHPSAPVDYNQVVSDIKRLAGNGSHTLLVISRPTDEQQGLDMVISLSQSFGRHYNAVLQQEGSTALQTANMLFATATRFLARYAPKAGEPSEVPLLYLDPTWRPKGKFWLDKLQSEWFLRGKPPVMGNPGDPENPDFRGGVILGKSYAASSALIDQMPDNQHWRKFLAWELFRNAVVTESIGDTNAAVLQPRPH